MKVQQHVCNTHSSNQSSCRSEYEVSYGALDRQASLSPPPHSSDLSSSSSWAHNTAAGSNSFRPIQPAPSRYHHNSHNSNHILHGVMGSSRVTKSVPQSQSRQSARYNSQSHHHPHHPIVPSQREAPFPNQFHLQNGPMSRVSYPSEYRSSPYHTPRGNRLPTLVDRIKAALAVQPSRQQPGMHPYADHGYRSDSSSYTSQPPSDYHSPSPSTPMPMPMPVAIPTPMLYGVKCTEVSQRAYSGQTSAMKSGFDRLQRLDSGKVEYRTIAFCTHLTVSRWETTSSGAPTGSFEPSAGAASSRNNPNHAAQLMSLANYIRHILSLTAGNPNAQPSQATVSNNQPQKQETTPKQTNSNNIAQEPHTSISRPLKAMSSRRHRHRYSPDYHDHAGQRHGRYLQHQQYSDYPTNSQQQPTIRPMGSESFQGPYDQDYREGNDSYEQHLESPHFHPQQQPQHQPRYPAQQYQQDHSYPPMRRSESPSSNAKSSDTLHHFPQPINTSRNVPQLPKVPFPNLTLTLALIYVDRLKAKNPEAKGEQGCSHRLFLIAFIIAAKYRCSVALSPPLSQESAPENSLYYDPPVVPEEDDEEEEQQSLESRLNSELIFSNHAWVRLLNLGSFARTPATPTSAGSGNTGSSGATLPISSSSSGGQQQYQHQQNSSPYLSSVPSSPQVSETSTMASNTPVPTTPTQGQTPNQAQQQPQQLQSLSSIMHSVTQSSSSPVSSSNAAGPILQVEDLDRMEAEFLTFLNFDLATMSHDLETCWNLLVGKKD